MISEIKNKLQSFCEKIKQVKHIRIILPIVLAVLVVGIYFLTLPKSQNKQQESIDNNRSEFSSSAEYVDYLENKLENVITSLQGVGNTEIVITLEKGFQYIYQTEEEVRTTSNGTSVSTTNVVLVDGQPLVLEEIYPLIKGIVVIAEGSSNVAVKMDIISVIQTVIDIDTAKIKIMEGK